MKEKWLSTLNGDIVKWSSVLKVYIRRCDVGHKTKVEKFFSYIYTSQGEELDFLDFPDVYVVEDNGINRNFEHEEAHLFNKIAVQYIEDSDEKMFEMWDLCEKELWEIFENEMMKLNSKNEI